MIQKLPVFFPPISNCYSACSGVASILQAYDTHNPALFLNRLYLFRKANNVLKFAAIERMNEVTAINCNDRSIDDLLIEKLNNNDYVFLFLDHFYIKGSSHFHLRHFIHDITLVYGYNSDEKIFYCADNFCDGKYLQAEVSYTELKDAWNNIPDSDSAEIFIFHYNEFVYNNQLDFHKLYLVMQDYFDGKFENVLKLNPTFLSNNVFGLNRGQNCTYETCVFGIKIYDWLLDYLKNADTFDLRPLHLLINHQDILLYLIECMQRFKENIHVQKYANILNRQKSNCEIARNLAIKYNITKDREVYTRVSDIITRVYSQESVFYDIVLSDRQIWE